MVSFVLWVRLSEDDFIFRAVKGTLMQISKFLYIVVLKWKKKKTPWKFVLLILIILELFNRELWGLFVYKHTETMENVKK